MRLVIPDPGPIPYLQFLDLTKQWSVSEDRAVWFGVTDRRVCIDCRFLGSLTVALNVNVVFESWSEELWSDIQQPMKRTDFR